jgi:hypothetical protein
VDQPIPRLSETPGRDLKATINPNRLREQVTSFLQVPIRNLHAACGLEASKAFKIFSETYLRNLTTDVNECHCNKPSDQTLRKELNRK